MEDNPVAPLAGAWIEILLALSIPTADFVAPLAGAWIEIDGQIVLKEAVSVAPLAGAWIEICYIFYDDTRNWSLPSRERGLKFPGMHGYGRCTPVAPLAGAWIEISIVIYCLS